MSSIFTTYSDESEDEKEFVSLYNCYFRPLFNYTFSKVNDRFIAQEIVQEAFISIWKQRSSQSIQSSRSYLFSTAKNLIISHYRKEYTRQYYYAQAGIEQNEYEASTDQDLLASDLQEQYEKGLQLLPPKCKEVFISSRKGHSNREIAQQLAISEKTVEQHITKALRLLRTHLKEYYAYLLLFFLS
ncbi:RNA polymerase sigma-70 factor [Spirosoma daeguense]